MENVETDGSLACPFCGHRIDGSGGVLAPAPFDQGTGAASSEAMGPVHGDGGMDGSAGPDRFRPGDDTPPPAPRVPARSEDLPDVAPEPRPVPSTADEVALSALAETADAAGSLARAGGRAFPWLAAGIVVGVLLLLIGILVGVIAVMALT